MLQSSLEVFWLTVQDIISEDGNGFSPAFKAIFQSPKTFSYVKSRIRRWKKPKKVSLDMILARMILAVWDIHRDMMKEMNFQKKIKKHYRKQTKRRQAVKSALQTYLRSIKEIPITCLETQNDNGKSIPFEFRTTENPEEILIKREKSYEQ